jgi:hypothetical protein
MPADIQPFTIAIPKERSHRPTSRLVALEQSQLRLSDIHTLSAV